MVLDVRQTADGHLAGVLQMAGSRASQPFEGIIELVGLIEVFLANPPAGAGIPAADGIDPGKPPG